MGEVRRLWIKSVDDGRLLATRRCMTAGAHGIEVVCSSKQSFACAEVIGYGNAVRAHGHRAMYGQTGRQCVAGQCSSVAAML
jgi:hypothetical protein